jgi:hypothetical protein
MSIVHSYHVFPRHGHLSIEMRIEELRDDCLTRVRGMDADWRITTPPPLQESVHRFFPPNRLIGLALVICSYPGRLEIIILIELSIVYQASGSEGVLNK